MDLFCVYETDDAANVGSVEYRTVAFADQQPSGDFVVSSLFPINDKEFKIDLPKDTWRNNDYSWAVFGVVVLILRIYKGR